ncbi:MAG: hypothetical protein ABIZ81_08190 [Opitutaceae bacterium]
MKSRPQVYIVTAIAAGLVFCAYTGHRISRQQVQLEAARRRLGQAKREASEERTRQSEAERELMATRAEVAALADQDAATNTGPGTDAVEIRKWIARVQQLRQLLAQRPDQQIPELKLLNELDWLAVARRIQGFKDEADQRESLATVRNQAKMKFAGQLASALEKFVAANDGMLPTDLFQVYPHFTAPIDPAALQRYEMRQSGKATDASHRGHAIVERAAVDSDYDSRIHLDAHGNFGAESPWRSAEMGDDVAAARQRFAAANNGQQPKDAGDLLLYIQSPITRGLMEATAEYQKAHGGRLSNDPADLLPYAKDPTTRVEIERLIQYRARQSR